MRLRIGTMYGSQLRGNTLVAYYYAIMSAGAVGAAWVSGGTRIIKAARLLTCAWCWAKHGIWTTPTTTP